MLNDNPTLDELRKELVKVANGEAVENSQINAIKALISLRLNEERLKYSRLRLSNQAIDTGDFETI